MSKSCLMCRWIVLRETGYSNYTVEDTDAHCVMGRNPMLPAEIPDEVRDYKEVPGKGYVNMWLMGPDNDEWHATRNSRCELYQGGHDEPVIIDVEGDDIPENDDAVCALLEKADPLPLMIHKYFKKEI